MLTKGTMAAVIAASAVVPVAAQAAEAEQGIKEVALKTADGKIATLSLEVYKKALAGKAIKTEDVTHVIANDDKAYPMEAYKKALAGAKGDTNLALEMLDKKGANDTTTSIFEGEIKNGKLVAKDETPSEVGDFKVESVKAINAALVSVTFSEKVDLNSAKEAKNYVFTKNNTKYGEGYTAITTVFKEPVRVLADGKTVVFELTPAGQLDNGDKYSIDVKNAVKSLNGGKVEAYGDTQKEFKDETAPVVTNAVLNDNKDSVRVYFNEAVSFSDADFGLTIDGVTIIDKNTLAPQKPTPELAFIALKDDKNQATGYVAEPVYFADIPLPADKKKDLTAVGEHEVTIYNLRDIVSRNGNGGNKVQLTGTTYEVTKQEDAAELVVTSVTPIDFNSLAVNFNRTPKKATIKVLKGDTVFYEQTLNAVGKSQQVDLPYTVLSVAKGLTTLYGKDATTADVRVIVENYEDENAVIGETYDKSLTLKREAQTPMVKGEKHNTLVEELDTTTGKPTNKNPKLVLPLEAYATEIGDLEVKDAAKVKVYDKNGVQRTTKSATANATALTVELVRADGSKEKFEDLAPFKVVVEAGALEVKTDKIDVASEKELAANGQTWTQWAKGDFTNKLQNKKFETTVSQTENPEKEDTNFKHIEGVKEVKVTPTPPTATTVTNVNKNVITVEYKDSMTASAAQLKNYKLDGKALPAGSEISMDTTSKIVTITLPEGSVAKTKNVRLQITKDVITANNEIIVGNINTKEPYMTDENLTLTDNVAPVMSSGKYQVATNDAKTTNVVEVTFSEALASNLTNAAGTLEFKANGTKAVEVEKVEAVTGKGNENKVLITLAEPVSISQKSTITVVEGAQGTEKVIKDAAGNFLPIGTTITVAPGADKATGDTAGKVTTAAKEYVNAELAKLATLKKLTTTPTDLTVKDLAAAKKEVAKANELIAQAKAAGVEEGDIKATGHAELTPAKVGEIAKAITALEKAVAEFNAEKAKVTGLTEVKENNTFKVDGETVTIVANSTDAGTIKKGKKFITVTNATALKTALDKTVVDGDKASDITTKTTAITDALAKEKIQVGIKED